MSYQGSTASTILIFLEKYEIMSQEEFEKKSKDKLFDILIPPYNIYFVCRRPKISIKQDCFKYDDNYIYLTLLIHNNSVPVKQEILIPNPEQGISYTLNTKFPFTFFEIAGDNGKVITGGKTSDLADAFKRDLPIFELLSMEIIYIGKLLDEKTSHNRISKFISYQTLQNIWFEQNNKYADKEVFFLLCQFRYLIYNGLILSNKRNTRKETAAIELLQKNLKNSDHDHLLSIAEAGLINYFKPIYNVPFYDIFLDKEHKSFKFFLKKNFRTLRMEMDLGMTDTKTYSAYVTPSMCHKKLFHCEKLVDRVVMKEK